MATPIKKYDDDALVLDIAHGTMSQALMAEKYGLSEVMIGQIVRGERRPELQDKIESATRGLIEQSRRLGARLAGVAMGRLGVIVGADSTAPIEVQRKAAVDILKFAHGDPAKPEVNVTQTQSFPGLDDADLEAIAKRKGGPK